MASKTTKGRKIQDQRKDENESEKQQCKKYRTCRGKITNNLVNIDRVVHSALF